jgi:hypothetical protein
MKNLVRRRIERQYFYALPPVSVSRSRASQRFIGIGWSYSASKTLRPRAHRTPRFRVHKRCNQPIYIARPDGNTDVMPSE